MAEITNPLLNLRIKLPYHLYVRVVVWPDLHSLRDNTPANDGDEAHVAIFVPNIGSNCVGALEFSATDLRAGTIAHEIEHMIEHFATLAWDEKRAQAVDNVTNEVTEALERAGLI